MKDTNHKPCAIKQATAYNANQLVVQTLEK